jgi:hypothetical protein
VSALQGLLWRALRDAGMLIDDARFDKVRLEAAAASRQHLSGAVSAIVGQSPAVIAKSFGLSRAAIVRVFGHGWQQAAGFAALAGVRANRVNAVAQLGALWSLGIVLFDHMLDTLPERRVVLLERLTPTLFHSPPAGARVPSGDVAIDFLVALAVGIVTGAQRMDGRPEDCEWFVQLLDEMYRGEQKSVTVRRVGTSPSPEVWEALRCKSALPATAIGVLALLGNPRASDAEREVVQAAASLVGQAFWIVDDLVDVQSDWEAGCWSRPLWLLLNQTRETPISSEEALKWLIESGIAASEAQQLGNMLTQLAALAGASERALLRPAQAAVRSWVDEIPAIP